jgi:FkbH-like protein
VNFNKPAGPLANTADQLGHARAKQAWRTFVDSAAEDKLQVNVRVGLSATFTVDPLVPMLGAALLYGGFVPDLKLAEYNQPFQFCLDHVSQVGGDRDVIVLLWRIEDLLAQSYKDFIFGDRRAIARAREEIDEFVQALAQLRRDFGGTLIVSLPPFPAGGIVDLLDLDNAANAGLFHRSVLSYFAERVMDAGQIRLLDLDGLQRDFGAKASFDPRKWSLYKQPYTEPFLWQIGQLTARIIRAGKVAPKKCIVLDCDNTLWGGIVGEDGVGGIALGQDFPGSGFRDLQTLMLYLRSQGVLLAVASKNNEDDVWQVFDSHDGMVLRREHLSAWRINWEPKAGNLQMIADELNIGIDSLVFIDDNPFETEQVAASGASVVTLDPDPARMVAAIKAMRLFDKLEVTEEDAKRADMMQAARKRTASTSETLSKEAFAATLGLRVALGEASPSQLGRIAQLINKTNQFNLSTLRRSAEEVSALHASPDWGVYALSVWDKFGDYGLVGVAIVEKGPTRWRIDTFLMSCRVLARGVETALLAKIAEDARHARATAIEAAFIPTAKNAPVASFLPDHGFTSLDGHNFAIPIEDVPKRPAYISDADAIS